MTQQVPEKMRPAPPWLAVRAATRTDPGLFAQQAASLIGLLLPASYLAHHYRLTRPTFCAESRSIPTLTVDNKGETWVNGTQAHEADRYAPNRPWAPADKEVHVVVNLHYLHGVHSDLVEGHPMHPDEILVLHRQAWIDTSKPMPAGWMTDAGAAATMGSMLNECHGVKIAGDLVALKADIPDESCDFRDQPGVAMARIVPVGSNSNYAFITREYPGQGRESIERLTQAAKIHLMASHP